MLIAREELVAHAAEMLLTAAAFLKDGNGLRVSISRDYDVAFRASLVAIGTIAGYNEIPQCDATPLVVRPGDLAGFLGSFSE